jgi:hydrogenase nickel incorporation protein HypA/HybF
MQELTMARDILEIIRAHVPPGSEGGVETVRVQIGELAGIMPENLDFCFQSLLADTPFNGARLEITHVPLTGCCNRCGHTAAMPVTEIVCPSCKSPDVTIIAGRELKVSDITVRDPVRGNS